MNRILAFVIAAAVLTHPLAAVGAVEFESFDGGKFTNPFFVHDFEFDDPCCWEITNCEESAGEPHCDLHLRPNADLITFDLLPGQFVESISILIRDFEGGLLGDDPTSVVIVRASSNDFVALHASALGVPEVLSADVESIGQLFGKPLGDIVSIHLQAANEGNSKLPGIGAFFDDITVIVVSGDLDGDGMVAISDLLILLAAWGLCEEPCPPTCLGDLNGDCTVGISDLLELLANWG